MNVEKSCGAIVFTREKDDYEFLIITHKSGHRGFPKGHVERNETEQQTALREVYEETGLKVAIMADFRKEERYYVKKNVLKTVVYFLAKAFTKEVVYVLPEVEAHTWSTLQEAQALLTYESQKNFLLQADAYLRNHADKEALAASREEACAGGEASLDSGNH